MNLDDRKSRILHAIIRDYVQTTRPVGSERLLEAYPLGCKSATVRNEMSELSDLGYIVQPHTSAGRIPTDRGYRYYVDTLMEPSSLEPSEERAAENLHQQTWEELDALLLHSCRILASLTSYLSIATDPITETTRLHRVYVTQAVARNALLVVVLSTGHVEHRLIEHDAIPNETTLLQLTNYLNSFVGDKELTEVAPALTQVMLPSEIVVQSAFLSKIVGMLNLVIANSIEQRRLYLEGSNQILKQPEFHDVQRLGMLYAALEEKNRFYRMLQSAWTESRLSIIIGAENSLAPMQECSVITSLYYIGGRPAGFLGVIGPTRMDYAHASAAVGFMAGHLSLALTALSQA
jgi:heat-inducible transcriptional repressor